MLFIGVNSIKRAAIVYLQNLAKKIISESITSPETIVTYVKAILEVTARGLDESIIEQLASTFSSFLFSNNEPAATYHSIFSRYFTKNEKRV